MKKAILLFSMVILVAGILFIKDADADTVLIKRMSVSEDTDDTILHTEILPDNESENESAVTMEEVCEDAEKIAVLATPQGANSFAFLRLTMDEQQTYVEILSSLLQCESETVLSTMNAVGIDKAFRCVMLDHPEIFYVDGYKYTEYKNGDQLEKITFTGNYLYNPEEISERRAAIEEVTNEILKNAPVTEDEFEKVKFAYDTVIERTEYNSLAKDNQNICSVFLLGKSVCQGYAKSIQYLLLKMGVEAQLVTGTVNSGDGHAWNLVFVNGEWYHLDATWGDAHYLFQNEEQQPENVTNHVNYDYMCVTTEQIMRTHSVDMPIEIPICNANADNYYVRNGLYFEEYEEQRIAQLFVGALEQNLETVTIKCGNDAVYESVHRRLIEEQHIFELVPVKDVTIAYTDNPQQKSITFWL